MDKNIILTLGCIVIFYLVYLKITEKTNKQNKPSKKNVEDDSEIEGFQNNIVTDSVDIYNIYKNRTKTVTSYKITKDNFDFDYETDFKYKDIPIIGDDNLEFFHQDIIYPNNNMNFQSQGGGNRMNEKTSSIKLPGASVADILNEESPNWVYKTLTGDPDFLVPTQLESNAIYSVPFPENTSIELAQFNAENVTDLFNSNNMEDLYNNINADVYRGYKTMRYML